MCFGSGLPPTEKRRGRLFSTPPQGGSDNPSQRHGMSLLGGPTRKASRLASPHLVNDQEDIATDITPPLRGESKGVLAFLGGG